MPRNAKQDVAKRQRISSRYDVSLVESDNNNMAQESSDLSISHSSDESDSLDISTTDEIHFSESVPHCNAHRTLKTAKDMNSVLNRVRQVVKQQRLDSIKIVKLEEIQFQIDATPTVLGRQIVRTASEMNALSVRIREVLRQQLSTEKTRTYVQISDTCLTSQPGVAHNISSPSQDTTSPVRRIRSPTHLRLTEIMMFSVTNFDRILRRICEDFKWQRSSKITRSRMQNSDNCMERQIEEALDENDSSPEIAPPIDSPRMNRNKVKRSLVESSVASPKSQQNASSDVGRLSADITVCFNRLRTTRRCEMSPKSTKMQDGTNSPIMKYTRSQALKERERGMSMKPCVDSDALPSQRNRHSLRSHSSADLVRNKIGAVHHEAVPRGGVVKKSRKRKINQSQPAQTNTQRFVSEVPVRKGRKKKEVTVSAMSLLENVYGSGFNCSAAGLEDGRGYVYGTPIELGHSVPMPRKMVASNHKQRICSLVSSESEADNSMDL